VTRFYLDTSVAAHALGGTAAAEVWFDAVTGDSQHELVSSRLLQTELSRMLRRDQAALADRDLILDHTGLVAISEAVLTSAEAISQHVKTLDAIHLATALLLGSRTVVASHDQNVQRVATELGLTWHDPVAGTTSPTMMIR
jgi:predicted nucleic acid-binding protein